MHSKTSKLYKSLDTLGFWQEGLGYKDIYGSKQQLSQNDKNAKLYKYVVQTEDRLYLFEWLLKRFQKDIFDRYNEAQVEKSQYGDNIERIQRIKDILLDLGLLWTNRYAKSLDFSKVVEGISGTESSFQIVYTLSKFVEASTIPIKAKEEVEGFDTLSELIHSKDSLVNQKLSLFPIDFPCQYDLTYEEVQKEVQNLKDEYQERLNKFEELVVKYQEKCEGTDGQIVYANEATKAAYARALSRFKEELFSFVEEYKIKKYKVKNMITRMESNKIGIPEELPDLIDHVSKRHSEVLEGTRLLESVDLDEKIDQLEVSLQKLSRS